MKNLLKICVVMFVVMITQQTWAAICSSVRICGGEVPQGAIPHCTEYSCYGTGHDFYSCSQCESGYTRSFEGNYPHSIDSCDYPSYVCDSSGGGGGGGDDDCRGCADCYTDTTWTAVSAGYETQTVRTCNCNTCSSMQDYRCAAGYYGTPDFTGASGCDSCAMRTLLSEATSFAGAKVITDCYVPSGTTSRDPSGSFKYTGMCYYTK